MGDDEDTEDIHPIRQQIQELEYTGDTEAVRKIRQEAERTLEHQLNTLDDIDTKAMAILRINMVLIGFILTAASLAANNELVPISDLNNPSSVFS